MSRYTVAPVEGRDTDDIMRLLERTFYIDEPLNKAVALCVNERCAELDAYCKNAILGGISFKAVGEEGNIVGVTLSGVTPLKEDENGNDFLSLAERCTNKKFQKILYILARREAGARLWERFPKDENCIELKIAATDPQWRKKGIMNALVAETEKATAQRGFRLLRMDTSSAYSAKTAEKLGFTCYYKALYTDIMMDGRPLIVPEPPHVDDRVYVKSLFEQ